MKLYNVFFVLSFFPLSAIAFQDDFFVANEKWKAQSQLKNPERMKYLEAVLEIDNSKNQDEVDGCYYLGSGGITQIIVINSDGVVDEVISESKSEKSECFKKVYLGLKYPKPPFSPIYDKMLMGYPEKK